MEIGDKDEDVDLGVVVGIPSLLFVIVVLQRIGADNLVHVISPIQRPPHPSISTKNPGGAKPRNRVRDPEKRYTVSIHLPSP